MINVMKCRVLPSGDVTAIEQTKITNETNEQNMDIKKWFMENTKTEK